MDKKFGCLVPIFTESSHEPELFLNETRRVDCKIQLDPLQNVEVKLQRGGTSPGSGSKA